MFLVASSIVAILVLGTMGQLDQIASVPLRPSTFFSVVWVTETITSLILAQETTPGVPLTTTKCLVFPTPVISDSRATQQTLSCGVFTPSHVTSPPPQMTTTKVVTETTTITSASTVSLKPPQLQPAPTSSALGFRWSAPPEMTDLSVFNISAFPGGQENLAIVNGIPARASAASIVAASYSTARPNEWDNSSSVLQLLYPAHSINPGNRPLGGAQFYASPLKVADAKNVTLEYSVFFPADFDWVLAGKLPGLYGGHSGCSGGDTATDCFSTRLMWRKGGFGELYLYAPKDEQTEALCSDPQSVCDAAYGFSIGRGSFTWAKGAWTTVRQSVTLNTPGKQDGRFTLYVNGQRVIDRSDIFYRNAPSIIPEPDLENPSADVTHHQLLKPTTTRKTGEGGLLGLGPLLGGILRRGELTVVIERPTTIRGSALMTIPMAVATEYHDQLEWAIGVVPEKELSSSTPSAEIDMSDTTLSKPLPTLTPAAQQTVPKLAKPVGFTGLFFSTFFGGHEPEYATPRDQYVWFKDFAMSCND